jgi:hypothetical protein
VAPRIKVIRPLSRLQYAFRAWCLFTAAWYLFVSAAVIATGGADVTLVLVALAALVLAAPVVFVAGCLEWTTRRGWGLRCVGLGLMIVGFLPLAFFSAVLVPFVFFSLPAAWPWKGGARRRRAELAALPREVQDCSATTEEMP